MQPTTDRVLGSLEMLARRNPNSAAAHAADATTINTRSLEWIMKSCLKEPGQQCSLSSRARTVGLSGVVGCFGTRNVGTDLV
jgi:hypothetical protein